MNKTELDSLLELADSRTYSRGMRYYNDDTIEKFRVSGDIAQATVLGSRSYRVSVGIINKEADFSCSCPMGMQGEFCKHLVAVVLTWIERLSNGESKLSGSKDKKLCDYLENLSKSDLIKIITSQCEKDEKLENILLLQTDGKESAESFDYTKIKKFLKKCFSSRDFVDYRAAPAFADEMNEGVDVLEQVLNSGDAKVCLDLTEHAMRLADEAALCMDDSDGHTGIIFERIEEIHRLASIKAKLKPEELADRLFKLAWDASFSQFSNCLETHKDSLGEEGIGHFKKRVEAAWGKIPPREPIKEQKYSFSEAAHQEDKRLGRSVVTSFMEQFAEESGDLDALVEIKKKNLQYAHDYGYIARLYREDRQAEKALDWIKKGIKIFPNSWRNGLAHEAIEVHQALNQFNEACELCWDLWLNLKSIDYYKQLKKISKKNNTWDTWHNKIHTALRSELSKDKPKSGSHLVTTLIFEGEVEEAWRVANEYNCDESDWGLLAALREKDHPLDAIPIYKKQVERILSPRNPGEYPKAANKVYQIGELYLRAKQGKLFVEYYEGLRVELKRIKNFMKALDEHPKLLKLIECA